jgi:uncharacterized membrane protein (Fun14 family)
MELTSDTILYGGAGFASGYAIGFIVKKAMQILLKFAMVLLTLFVTALIYLQSIKVININEKALDNLVNEGYQRLNQTIGTEAIVNPMQYVVETLGLPLSGGLGFGLIVGWLRS